MLSRRLVRTISDNGHSALRAPASREETGARGCLEGCGGAPGYDRKGPFTSYVIPPDELPLVPRWLEK